MPTIETDDVEIEYYIQKTQEYANVPPVEYLDVKRVSVYVPFIDDWLDVTDVESEQLDKKINKLIDSDRCQFREKQYDKYQEKN
jgi:hypothetical protein